MQNNFERNMPYTMSLCQCTVFYLNLKCSNIMLRTCVHMRAIFRKRMDVL